MNIHHLELFYHVARFGGVSAAARQMPYGIQQSTISAQILQLEDTLGKPLFRRRPFELYPEGKLLFAFIEPFFGGLDAMADRVRGGAETHLRIACPELVQRDHLPAILTAVRSRLPDFHFSLECARLAGIREGLRAGKIDVGLASAGASVAAESGCRVILRMPLVLLVSASSGLTDAASILGRDRIDLPLLCLPGEEPTSRIFQEELQRQGIDWYPALELASLELITHYVAAGFGVGLGLRIPGASCPPGVRPLPLPGFPEVVFGAFTNDEPTPLAELFIAEAEAVARRMIAG
jgi:DNA-binding transcriptional LysR family regulator